MKDGNASVPIPCIHTDDLECHSYRNLPCFREQFFFLGLQINCCLKQSIVWKWKKVSYLLGNKTNQTSDLNNNYHWSTASHNGSMTFSRFYHRWRGVLTHQGHVGDGEVPWFSSDLDWKTRFEGRFIKAGKGHSGRSRFKLCWSQHPSITGSEKKDTARRQGL